MLKTKEIRKTKERNFREKSKNGIHGITLIALVITIIVLLILAGVTITSLSGDNGILKKSEKSSLEMSMANVMEKIELIAVDHKLQSNINGIEEDTMQYLSNKGILKSDNVIDTDKLEINTNYGKGTQTDVFKIIGSKLVYIDANGNRVAERDINIYNKRSLITEWTVTDNDTVMLPISIGYIGDNNFTVDWGDGSPEETISDEANTLDALPSHNYSKAGTYRISITGKCSFFSLSAFGEDDPQNMKPKLTKLVSWGEIESLGYEFAGAINLEGNIPSPTTNTFAKYSELDSESAKNAFNYLFLDCSKITSIPSDLFSNAPEDVLENITELESLFKGCTELTQIPNGLFDKMTNVVTLAETFRNCSKITSIPENLFANLTKATTFNRVFADCTGIKSIPDNLFANCPNATNFEKAFYTCINVESIPQNIFSSNPNITNLKYTFYNLDKITTVPSLWERTTEGLDGTGCFGNCDNVDTSSLSQSIIDIWFAYET